MFPRQLKAGAYRFGRRYFEDGYATYRGEFPAEALSLGFTLTRVQLKDLTTTGVVSITAGTQTLEVSHVS